MNGYEFAAAVVKSLSWPLVVFTIFVVLRKTLKALIERVNLLKASKDGFELNMGQISKAILDGAGWGWEGRFDEEKKKRQILMSGSGQGGSFKLFANGIIVARRAVVLAPGSNSCQASYGLSMVHECTNVQFIGDVKVNVIKLDANLVTFTYEPSSSERTIELVATGL